MILPAIFAIVVGLGMIFQWLVFYARRQIPELRTEPVRIRFHLAAEFTTALGLITAGAGILSDQTWKLPVFYLAMGMLVYTVIISPGYFAQKRQWGVVGVFSVVLVLALLSIYWVLYFV